MNYSLGLYLYLFVSIAIKGEDLHHSKNKPSFSAPTSLSSVNLAQEIKFWIFYSETKKRQLAAPSRFCTSSVEGIEFSGTSYRYGGRLSLIDEKCLEGKRINVKWKIRDAFSYNDFAISVYYNINAPAPALIEKDDLAYFSSDYSYNGSTLIENEEWYYTTIIIDGLSATTYTCKFDYYENQGEVINKKILEMHRSTGYLSVRSGDTYSGSSLSMIVSEFYIFDSFSL